MFERGLKVVNPNLDIRYLCEGITQIQIMNLKKYELLMIYEGTIVASFSSVP
jgi:hypothetical protein